MTEYVILCRDCDSWLPMDTRPAWSPAAAIRDYAVEADAVDGDVYIAIPARAWKPMRVSAKSEIRVTVEAEA